MTLAANSIRFAVLAALVPCLALLAFAASAAAEVATGSSICLLSSAGAPLAGASTQYYQDGWKSYGATVSDGCAHGTGLAGNLPIGITYGGVYRQENHDFTAGSPMIFQTVATTVKLTDSTGTGISGGTAQYYANGWHQLGITDSTGAVTTELLPGSTPFGMTAGGIYNQQTQDPSLTSVVLFKTVPTTVKLTDSKGAGIPGGTAQYYANGWHQLGITDSTGAVTTELLPGSTPFGMTAGGIYNQQTQDPSLTSVVLFKTVPTTVKLTDSKGAGIPGGTAQYYANGWHQLGITDSTGAVTTELLPGSTPFGMTAGGIYNQQTQDPSVTSVVLFKTVPTTVKLTDSTGTGIPGGAAQYYANGWHQLGITDSSGAVTTELLAGNTPFGMTSGGIYNQQTQDPTVTSVVLFKTVHVTVTVEDASGGRLAGASTNYYGNGWRSIGTTDSSGSVAIELLPASTPFNSVLGSTSAQVTQSTGDHPSVLITLALAGAPVPTATTFPSASVEFVSATETVVTWRITPASPATLYYWDAVASCTAIASADCQDMIGAGHGKTTASGGVGQGFLVTQNFMKDGDSCHVTNEVTYGPREDKASTRTASATYDCSGMPALGWPGLGALFALGFIGATVVWQRSKSSSRFAPAAPDRDSDDYRPL